MSQNSKMIGVIILAFVVYTTMRGHLRNYLHVLGVVN